MKRELADLSKANDPGVIPQLEWPLVRVPLDREERDRVFDVAPLEVLADRWLLEIRITNRLVDFLVGRRCCCDTEDHTGES